MAFENFPYTNFHEMNMDWILSIVKNNSAEIRDFILTNKIRFADPDEWNIQTPYPAGTIVLYNNSLFVSKKAVHGEDINNDEYWSKIIDLSSIKSGITITPEQFGAKADGNTDDTEAIQNAVNYASTNDKICLFNRKTYRTNSIRLPSFSKIIILGTIKNLDNQPSHIFECIENQHDIIIDGFNSGVLDGNKDNVASELAFTPLLFGVAEESKVNNVIVRNLTIKNSLYWGFSIIGDNCIVDNCKLIDNNYFSYIGPNSKHCKISNCFVTGVVNDWGLGTYGPVEDCIIEKCYATNNHESGIAIAGDSYQPDPPKNVIIKDCYSYENKKAGFTVGGWSGTAKNITVENCTSFNNLKNTEGDTVAGFYIAYVDNITIMNCISESDFSTTKNGHGFYFVGNITNATILNSKAINESGNSNFAILFSCETLGNVTIDNFKCVNYSGLGVSMGAVNNEGHNTIVNTNLPTLYDAKYQTDFLQNNENFKNELYGSFAMEFDGQTRAFRCPINMIAAPTIMLGSTRGTYGNYVMSASPIAFEVLFDTAPLAGFGTGYFNFFLKC